MAGVAAGVAAGTAAAAAGAAAAAVRGATAAAVGAAAVRLAAGAAAKLCPDTGISGRIPIFAGDDLTPYRDACNIGPDVSDTIVTRKLLQGLRNHLTEKQVTNPNIVEVNQVSAELLNSAINAFANDFVRSLGIDDPSLIQTIKSYYTAQAPLGSALALELCKKMTVPGAQASNTTTGLATTAAASAAANASGAANTSAIQTWRSWVFGSTPPNDNASANNANASANNGNASANVSGTYIESSARMWPDTTHVNAVVVGGGANPLILMENINTAITTLFETVGSPFIGLSDWLASNNNEETLVSSLYEYLTANHSNVTNVPNFTADQAQELLSQLQRIKASNHTLTMNSIRWKTVFGAVAGMAGNTSASAGSGAGRNDSGVLVNNSGAAGNNSGAARNDSGAAGNNGVDGVDVDHSNPLLTIVNTAITTLFETAGSPFIKLSDWLGSNNNKETLANSLYEYLTANHSNVTNVPNFTVAQEKKLLSQLQSIKESNQTLTKKPIDWNTVFGEVAVMAINTSATTAKATNTTTAPDTTAANNQALTFIQDLNLTPSESLIDNAGSWEAALVTIKTSLDAIATKQGKTIDFSGITIDNLKDHYLGFIKDSLFMYSEFSKQLTAYLNRLSAGANTTTTNRGFITNVTGALVAASTSALVKEAVKALTTLANTSSNASGSSGNTTAGPDDAAGGGFSTSAIIETVVGGLVVAGAAAYVMSRRQATSRARAALAGMNHAQSNLTTRDLEAPPTDIQKLAKLLPEHFLERVFFKEDGYENKLATAIQTIGGTNQAHIRSALEKGNDQSVRKIISYYKKAENQTEDNKAMVTILTKLISISQPKRQKIANEAGLVASGLTRGVARTDVCFTVGR